MAKMKYDSPELEVLWFEAEEILSGSIVFEEIPGDGVVDDDEDW